MATKPVVLWIDDVWETFFQLKVAYACLDLNQQIDFLSDE